MPEPTTEIWLPTYTGRRFIFLGEKNSPGQICLTDVAHSLALICRYGGHTTRHYSVAEHSVRVSYLVPRRVAAPALLHDAHEAYVGDCVWPLKQLLPDYQRVETEVFTRVMSAFGRLEQYLRHRGTIQTFDSAIRNEEESKLHAAERITDMKNGRAVVAIEPTTAHHWDWNKWGMPPEEAERLFLRTARWLGVRCPADPCPECKLLGLSRPTRSRASTAGGLPPT